MLLLIIIFVCTHVFRMAKQGMKMGGGGRTGELFSLCVYRVYSFDL